MLGGAIPNRTGDLNRAVGAVKSLTLVSFGQNSWSIFVLPLKLPYSIKTDSKIDPKIVKHCPNSITNILWDNDRRLVIATAPFNGGDRVAVMEI